MSRRNEMVVELLRNSTPSRGAARPLCGSAASRAMALLIDGYNLLHAAGVFPPDTAEGSLANARAALVDFLCRVLPAAELPRTVMVFDARQAPPGLPRSIERGGITLLFAPRHQSADEAIAELIELEPSPRTLTVVSSDHQVQRAARRRRARAVDSDRWCREILAAGRAAQESSGEVEPHKSGGATPLSDGEVAFWMDQFGTPRQRRKDPGRMTKDE